MNTRHQLSKHCVLLISVDGSWSAWDEWSSCSQTCDGGQSERRRYCNEPAPDHGGSPCGEADYELEIFSPCIPNPCPGKIMARHLQNFIHASHAFLKPIISWIRRAIESAVNYRLLKSTWWIATSIEMVQFC